MRLPRKVVVVVENKWLPLITFGTIKSEREMHYLRVCFLIVEGNSVACFENVMQLKYRRMIWQIAFNWFYLSSLAKHFVPFAPAARVLERATRRSAAGSSSLGC